MEKALDTVSSQASGKAVCPSLVRSSSIWEILGVHENREIGFCGKPKEAKVSTERYPQETGVGFRRLSSP